jgi:hypothetical protein
MEFDGNQWTASLIAFGGEAGTHEIKVLYNGELSQQVDVKLLPGSIGRISGELPPDFEKGLLILGEDKFGWDNVLPFVYPSIKPLNYSVKLKDAEQAAWVDKLMKTLPGAQSLQPAVLRWLEGWPLETEPETPAEIWWLNGEATSAFAVAVPGGESLAEGLSWDGFLALPYSGFQTLPSDQVQLWMGEQPLVIRRDSQAGTRLLMNFEWETSNAMRFPSMLLLLHRFMKEQQQLQPLPFSTQLETRQLLPVRAKANETLQTRFEDLDDNVMEGEMNFSSQAPAPERPGTFRVKRGEEILMQAGVFSGDVAEGNFLQAKPHPLPDRVVMDRRQKNSQTDFLMPLWFALLMGALTLAWWSERSG